MAGFAFGGEKIVAGAQLRRIGMSAQRIDRLAGCRRHAVAQQESGHTGFQARWLLTRHRKARQDQDIGSGGQRQHQDG
jgi:hypothetical protein